MDPNLRRHQEDRRQELHRLSRRNTLALSSVVGFMAGALAVLFQVLVQYIEAWRTWLRFHVALTNPPAVVGLVCACAALGALAVILTRRFCPEAGGSGIPHVKAVLLSARQLSPARLISVKLGCGLLALAAGMSLGREGPTVHLGAACAAYFAIIARLPGRTRRALIASGAGAGLAAAFNAPLAGFLFIMEELHREMSPGTYGKALITAVSSVAVTRFLLGQASSFSVPDSPSLPVKMWPAVVLVGVAAAFVGVCFNQLLVELVRWRQSHSVPGPYLGAVTGALGGLLLCYLPEITGGGNDLTQSLLRGSDPRLNGLGLLWILLCGKFLFTVLSYTTGVPGGVFAPILSLGAIVGAIVGNACHALAPAWIADPSRLVAVGMAAVLAASVRAPLTGVVLIVEMTGQYHVLYSLLLGSFVAYAIAESLRVEPLYDALLGQDLDRRETCQEDDARVLDLCIEPGSRLDRARVDNLHLPEDLLIAIVERSGRMLVPRGSTWLESGDLLTVVAGPHCDDGELKEFVAATRAP